MKFARQPMVRSQQSPRNEADQSSSSSSVRALAPSAKSSETKVASVGVDTVPRLLKLAQLHAQEELRETKSGNKRQQLGAWMASKLANKDVSVLSLLPSGSQAAIESPELESLSYDELRAMLRFTNIRGALGLDVGSRVGISVQNGSHLGVALLATIQSGCCCCPLELSATEEELHRDILQLHLRAMLVDSATGPARTASASRGLACALMVPKKGCAGSFTLSTLDLGAKPSSEGERAGTGGTPDDSIPTFSPVHAQRLQNSVLVLTTSGTTGRKKAVPYDMETLAVGAACIITSWQLTASDVCLTMMPLTHVGGIVRNLFAVLLSGGRLFCYPSFDPVAFWPFVEDRGITWYYASPTMHRAILEEGRNRKHKHLPMRMVCNAAGALPPSLAQELRERLGCVVLPSYGMTECMPISSPPVDFAQLAPKTSGVPCGPEVAIVNDEGGFLQAGETGNIAVRGPPTMSGYEDSESNQDCWREGGWFLTGDLGYLSMDGWLQVTGRTKEVIKRGGETLAPMEVEEIVMRHLRHEFQEVAAFGIKDVEMGENVALAIVTRPNRPRIGLPRIHSALHGVLRPQLWPQALVYCETNLPKTSTGKVQRAKLSKACNSIVVSQRMPWRERVFHAVLNQKHSRDGFQILRPVETSKELMADDLSSAAELALRPLFLQTVTRLLSDGKTSVLYALGEAGREQVHELFADLDDFDKPDAVVQIRATEFPEVFPAPKALDFLIDKDYEPPSSEEEKTICKVWANILGCDEGIISVSTDFFEAGGTSLQAGRVASELRMYFHRNVPIHWIFANPRLKDLARVIKEASEIEDFWPQESNNSRLSAQVTADDSSIPFLMDERVDICSRREDMGPSSVNPLVLMIQFVVPITNVALQQLCVMVSFFMGLRWSALYMVDLQLEERELVSAITALRLNYFVALGLAWIVSNCFLPFVGILIKWTVVGRLQPGKYPLWGLQYVQWWIAKNALESFGIGVFAFTQPTRRFYLRILGASISSTANVSPLGAEAYVAADLLDLREGVMVDGARLKSTALDARSGHIIFTPLLLEKGVCVGYRSIITPGARIEADTCIGPLSTSYELQDADDRWRKFNSFTLPEPHVLLRVCLGYPLKSLCSLVTILPWILLLQYVTAGILWRTEKIHWLTLGIEELSQPHRIIAWILAFALARTGLNSVIYVTLVILLKWLVIGRFRPGPWRESQWAVFQYWFMALLLESGYIEQFAALVGPHYYLMTVYYKLMGSNVGKRIFWPGKPLEIIEYDLLEVGDDVTFGSRTAIRCSDAAGMQKVRILTGAMVADNCIILPGTVVGENVVLGTGSLGNGVYQNGTLCIGNQHGGAVILRGRVHRVEDYFSQDASSEICTPVSRLDSPNESEEGSNASVTSSSRPFGRVFYADDCGFGTCWSSNVAPYAILGWPGIFAINVLVRLVWAPVECSHRWLVLILLNLCLSQMRFYHLSNWSILLIILVLTLAVQFTKLMLKVLMDVALKWILLGKREPGIFTWDTSSYCQRWKIYTSIRHVLESEMSQFGGSFWIILYYRLLGASIGSNVCLYPWGASPMMTEPDLVTIGDGACVEAAHLVAHTNVHGEFRLEEVKIGDFCTLRDNSRVVSGAEMLEGSTLLEHSLVMPGEVMPADTCWQGWPNRWQGTSKQNP